MGTYLFIFIHSSTHSFILAHLFIHVPLLAPTIPVAVVQSVPGTADSTWHQVPPA